MFTRLIEEAKYCEGVEEFFLNLDRKKYIPVLVSGGFQNLNARAQKELKIMHSFSACEYFFDKDEYLSSWNLYASDFDDKYDHVKLLFKQYGLNAKTDWVFIGDGKNDKDIAKKAPLSIAFGDHAHPDLVAICDFHIKNFMELNAILNDFETGRIDIPTDSDSHMQIKATKETNSGKLESIIKQRDDTLKHNRLLKKELSELKNLIDGRQQKAENYVPAYESDYLHVAKVNLEDILFEHKIAFIGLKEGQSHFKALKSLHPNLITIPGDNNRFDKSKLAGCEFIFFFTSSAGHSTGWRLDADLQRTPHSILYLDIRNTDSLKIAITNILARHWKLK
jgi:hypothetical protein